MDTNEIFQKKKHLIHPSLHQPKKKKHPKTKNPHINTYLLRDSNLWPCASQPVLNNTRYQNRRKNENRLWWISQRLLYGMESNHMHLNNGDCAKRLLNWQILTSALLALWRMTKTMTSETPPFRTLRWKVYICKFSVYGLGDNSLNMYLWWLSSEMAFWNTCKLHFLTVTALRGNTAWQTRLSLWKWIIFWYIPKSNLKVMMI